MKTTAKASLGLASKALCPDVVTNLVGIRPSWTTEKGKITRPNQRVPSHQGIWAVEAVRPKMDDAILALLELVEPRIAQIREAAAKTGAVISVALWWEPEGGQGGYTLCSEVVRRLSALGERVDFYFA